MTTPAEPVADTAKICDLLGITPKDTTDLKKIGALTAAAGRGRWLLKSSVQNYTAHLRRLVDLKANDAATLNKELVAKKIIKTEAEGELAKLRVETEKGLLINAAEVRQSGLRIGSILTARLEILVVEAAASLSGLEERQLQQGLRRKTQEIIRDIKRDLSAVDKNA